MAVASVLLITILSVKSFIVQTPGLLEIASIIWAPLYTTFWLNVFDGVFNIDRHIYLSLMFTAWETQTTLKSGAF
jgi:hypothetical protein